MPPGPTSNAIVVPEPLHRLNRLEYNNTIRDLLGVSSQPADAFPPDPPLGGFDNIAAGLTLTPALFNLYADVALDVARAALEVGPQFHLHKLAKEVASGGHEVGGRGWSLYDVALNVPEGDGDRLGGVHDLLFEFELPQDENVTISITAGGNANLTDMPLMGVQLNDTPKQQFEVNNRVVDPREFSLQASLPAGSHRVTITFDNFDHNAGANRINELVLFDLEVTSEATAVPASRASIETCDPRSAPEPGACYADILTNFARRAWRRNLNDEEKNRLVSLWQQLSVAEGQESALVLTVRAVLLSPHFIYRTAKPLAGAPVQEGVESPTVPLDDFSLASRLSYFVWASMPDDALLDAAEQGRLRDDVQLAAELSRMLADPKAAGLHEGFAAQWLSARKLQNANPNPDVYPEFDEPLRAAMQEEAGLFFGDFFTNQQPLGNLLTPDFAYVNDRLAQHYNYPLPGSTGLVRVPLAPGARAGLATQGAWLTAQSEPNRTSPVLRGRWVAEELICMEIPSAPPGVPPIEEGAAGATVREQLELHRAKPECAVCHTLLDPPGLGLEEFDGIGKQRDSENGAPIDTTGGLPGGPNFTGGAELAAALEQDPRFYECMTKKLMTYAMGRLLVGTDNELVNEVVGAVDGSTTTLDQLVQRIVLSPSFRMMTPTTGPTPSAESGSDG